MSQLTHLHKNVSPQGQHRVQVSHFVREVTHFCVNESIDSLIFFCDSIYNPDKLTASNLKLDGELLRPMSFKAIYGKCFAFMCTVYGLL